MSIKTRFLAIPNSTGSYKDLVDNETSTAAATREPAIVAGVNGLPSLDFDGSNDSILKTVDADLNFRKAFTCFVLIKLDQLKNYNHIISRQDSTDFNFDIYSTSGGEVSIRLRSVGLSGTWSTATGVLKTNQYNLIAVSWSAQNTTGSLACFVNGVKIYSANPTCTELTDSLGYKFTVGSYHGYASHTDGAIQLVRIDADDDTAGHLYSDAQHQQFNMLLRRKLYLPSDDGLVFCSGEKTISEVPDRSGVAGSLVVGGSGTTLKAADACNGRSTLNFNGSGHANKLYAATLTEATMYLGIKDSVHAASYGCFTTSETGSNSSIKLFIDHLSGNGFKARTPTQLTATLIPLSGRNALSYMALRFVGGSSIELIMEDGRSAGIFTGIEASIVIGALTLGWTNSFSIQASVSDALFYTKAHSYTEIYSEFKELRRKRT